MMSYLASLKSETVQSCRVEEATLVLRFRSQKLVVHNRHRIQDARGRVVAASRLVGARITDLVATDANLKIGFGSITLQVDFSDRAWTGPEAAVLYIDGTPVIVWH